MWEPEIETARARVRLLENRESRVPRRSLQGIQVRRELALARCTLDRLLRLKNAKPYGTL